MNILQNTKESRISLIIWFDILEVTIFWWIFTTFKEIEKLKIYCGLGSNGWPCSEWLFRSKIFPGQEVFDCGVDV